MVLTLAVALPETITPYLLLMLGGFVVGTAGHLAGSRRTVVVGLAILFVASALLLAGGYLAFQEDPVDPRPCDAPGGC